MVDLSIINKEIEEIIKEPTVTMCKDGTPIEYKSTEGVRKTKVREINNISVQLIAYIATKGGGKNSLRKFSSGDLGRYLSLYKMFN